MENTNTSSTSARDRPWMDRSISPDERANLLLAQMTRAEKINMLREQSGMGLSPSRLGIPPLTFADGPAGVRIDRSRRDVNEGKATSPPAPIALAATWDLTAAKQYGDMLGLEAWATGHNVLLSFKIKNTGEWAGAEIAQVYLGLPASTDEPPKRLVDWLRVELEPGKTREVSVLLDPYASSRLLSYWDVNTNGWEIAIGDYQVYVGASSRDIRLTGSFHVRFAKRE